MHLHVWPTNKNKTRRSNNLRLKKKNRVNVIKWSPDSDQCVELIPQTDGGAVITGDSFLPLADAPAGVRFGAIERWVGGVDQTVLPLSTQSRQSWTRTGGNGSEMSTHLQEAKQQRKWQTSCAVTDFMTEPCEFGWRTCRVMYFDSDHQNKQTNR